MVAKIHMTITVLDDIKKHLILKPILFLAASQIVKIQLRLLVLFVLLLACKKIMSIYGLI